MREEEKGRKRDGKKNTDKKKDEGKREIYTYASAEVKSKSPVK